MSDQLTDAQRAVVEHFEGPLMVLAGPGSGKTRVIIHRIAQLLRRGVSPKQVLALTFTNKAAREMAERAHQLLDGARVEVSTFHRFCAQLLRLWPDQVGLKANFTILDSSDQAALVRKIMKEFGLDTKLFTPQQVLNKISKARNNLITANDFHQRHEENVGSMLDAMVDKVFPEYERQLLAQNCVDFDALLLHVVEMLHSNAELREYLDLQYRFVLVDEYQDTNLAQYKIVHALSQHCPNLCATGDPDQSIYGWRGARPANIKQFEKDFASTKILALDQNFRSTAAIVRCADELISKNPRRHRKGLYTDNAEGESVRLRIYADGDAEADSIAKEISQAVAQQERRYSDFAIFYRVNALSRSMETALSRHQVPFQVASGYSFYERVEVRDLVGYLRLIENPADDSAFDRVVNRPARGIGAKTLERITAYAQQHKLTMLEAAARAEKVPALAARRCKPLLAFADMIEQLRIASQTGSVSQLIERVIAEIDYLSLWRDENDEVDEDRQANIHELVTAARRYEDTLSDTDVRPTLQRFLELASLTSEADSIDPEKGAVTLMTMHAAKGLEFPVVFILAVENGFIPHERAVQDGNPESFQEERRLLFVGVTRAMSELNLTQTREREFRGRRQYTISSPFLSEMNVGIVCEDDGPAPLMQQRMTHNEYLQRAKQRYATAQQAQQFQSTPKLMTASDLQRKLEALKAQASMGDAARALSSSGKPVLTDADDTKNGMAEATVDHPFTVGASVRHPRYGRGRVMAATGGANRGTATVVFENDEREETFVVAHAPLTLIGQIY